jgi:putative flippase GtrA
MRPSPKAAIAMPAMREIVLYGLIGGLSASVDSCLYYGLTRILLANTFVANFIGVNAGITLSFYLNAYYTFHATDRLARRAPRFFSIGYGGLLLSMLFLFVGVKMLKLNDMHVKVVSIFVVAACQFLLNKYVTFRSAGNR